MYPSPPHHDQTTTPFISTCFIQENEHGHELVVVDWLMFCLKRTSSVFAKSHVLLFVLTVNINWLIFFYLSRLLVVSFDLNQIHSVRPYDILIFIHILHWVEYYDDDNIIRRPSIAKSLAIKQREEEQTEGRSTVTGLGDKPERCVRMNTCLWGQWIKGD